MYVCVWESVEMLTCKRECATFSIAAALAAAALAATLPAAIEVRRCECDV